MKKEKSLKPKLFTNEEIEFIEKCGLTYEKRIGIPRIGGKIIGFLLISNPPEQNLGEIQKALKVSKGSVSTMIRIIEKIGFVEMVTFPGKRSTFFRITALNEDFFRKSMDDTREFKNLMEMGMKTTGSAQTESNRRIREWLSFYNFMDEKFPKIFKQWFKENEKFNRGKRV